MECKRRLEDFSHEELNTDTCRHECYCEMKGGCPLFSLYTDEERTQRYETLCEEMGLEPYPAD